MKSSYLMRLFNCQRVDFLFHWDSLIVDESNQKAMNLSYGPWSNYMTDTKMSSTSICWDRKKLYRMVTTAWSVYIELSLLSTGYLFLFFHETPSSGDLGKLNNCDKISFFPVGLYVFLFAIIVTCMAKREWSNAHLKFGSTHFQRWSYPIRPLL